MCNTLLDEVLSDAQPLMPYNPDELEDEGLGVLDAPRLGVPGMLGMLRFGVHGTLGAECYTIGSKHRAR